jgi:hypothetical protein
MQRIVADGIILKHGAAAVLGGGAAAIAGGASAAVAQKRHRHRLPAVLNGLAPGDGGPQVPCARALRHELRRSGTDAQCHSAAADRGSASKRPRHCYTMVSALNTQPRSGVPRSSVTGRIGVVEEVGPLVKRVQPGDRVLIVVRASAVNAFSACAARRPTARRDSTATRHPPPR